MMNEQGKSDSPIVPRNSPNNIAKAIEEAMEGRGLAKGNPPKRTTPRTQGRISVPHALERVRQAAKKDRNSGSPRSCTMSTMSNDCVWHTMQLSMGLHQGSMVRHGSTMERIWRRIFTISPGGSGEERTERSQLVERTFPRQTVGKGQSDFQRWRIR